MKIKLLVKRQERRIIKAALAENKCRCTLYDCKHLYALWDAAEKLAQMLRKK